MGGYNLKGFIYVIRSSSGLHKIGLAKSVEARLKQLRKQYAGETLEVIRTIKTDNMDWAEGLIHHRLKEKRVTGEWFNLEPDDFKAFDWAERIINSSME